MLWQGVMYCRHSIAYCIKATRETLARVSSSLLGLLALFCHQELCRGTGLPQATCFYPY